MNAYLKKAYTTCKIVMGRLIGHKIALARHTTGSADSYQATPGFQIIRKDQINGIPARYTKKDSGGVMVGRLL